jgi:hypothetical protein
MAESFVSGIVDAIFKISSYEINPDNGDVTSSLLGSRIKQMCLNINF